jgi:hypothetical protein
MKTFNGRNSEQERTANLPFLPFAIVAVLTITLMIQVTQVSMSNIVANSFGISFERPIRQNKKIAIISGYVPSAQKADSSRVTELDELINKACYAYLWGYDFIFNTTNGFDESFAADRHWLKYGTWSRVPHISARIKEYDWILYTDTDYVINDITRPLESFLKEFEFYGHQDVHIFVPKDNVLTDRFTFSAFAVMIRNSPFGLRVLDHWMELAGGLCPNGNFKSDPEEYRWEDSDQPGIWYALVKTHKEFFPMADADNPDDFPQCNTTTGLMDAPWGFGVYIDIYFRRIKAVIGNGADLSKVPKGQPIIWSLESSDYLTGLGLQAAWGNPRPDVDEHLASRSFAMHAKSVDVWTTKMKDQLQVCKDVHGCYAEYHSDDSNLHIGCNTTKYYPH